MFSLLAFYIVIGLIAVAAIAYDKRTSKRKKAARVGNLNDAQKELFNIKIALFQLKNRIATLEKRLSELCPPAAEPQESKIAQEEPESARPALVKAEPKGPSEDVAGKKRESLEFRVGKYWLSRIGIVSFVFAIAFFIVYSFKYLGPWPKLIIGYISSFGLLTFGWHLEKKEGYRWLSRVLFGGGWGLLYFTVFAMHNVEATRVVKNPALELVFLGIVSAGAVIFALRYKSSTAVGLAYILGYLTAVSSDLTYFTMYYYAILVASLIFLVWKMRWEKLLLFGIVITFFTHIFWVRPQLDASKIITLTSTVPLYKFKFSFWMLSYYWLMFNIGIFLLVWRLENKKSNLLADNVFNASLFILLALRELHQAIPHLRADIDYEFYLLVVFAALYFIFAFIARLLKNKDLILTNAAIAISAGTMAVPLRVSMSWVSTFWLFEAAALLGLGIYYRRLIFKFLASLLATVLFFRLFIVDIDCTKELFWVVQHNVFVFCLGIGCYYFCGLLNDRLANKEDRLHYLDRLLANLFIIAGSIFLTSILYKEAPRSWLSACYLLEVCALTGLGIYYRKFTFKFLAALLMAAMFIRLFVVDLGSTADLLWSVQHNVFVFALGVFCCYALAPTIEKSARKDNSLYYFDRFLANVYIICGTTLLTYILHAEIEARWLSSFWAAEGIFVFMLGFLLRKKTFRICGFLVLGLAILRVGFFDLSGINTIYRIFALLILGLVSLSISFWYSKIRSE
ncbi:MAG: DUF2339 domain-containing protein [Candidatus Omnitrophica bacterium]|nr:DUF2339 domain-containing protein [Candidatus Omnitrophota bacterium]